MSVIKLVGAGSINTAERRKLRRMGRIAARKVRAAGNYAPVRVWVEFFEDEGGMPTSTYSITPGTWVERPRVYDGIFSWSQLKNCELAKVQRVRKVGQSYH